MLIRDVEMFIEHCENKGLAAKTIGSYEQTLRLLMLYLDEQGITQTEKITHTVIQNYVKQIKERGKYTVTSNPNSGNYQERRLDFGKKVSDVTINNYLRNMSAFFGWCVEEDLILRSPVKRGDYIKVERRPLEFVSDEDFRKLLRNHEHGQFQRVQGFYRHSAFARYWHEGQRMSTDSSNGCEFAKAVHLSPGGKYQRKERPLCILL